MRPGFSRPDFSTASDRGLSARTALGKGPRVFPLLRAGLAVSLTFVVACADLATAPIPMVTLRGSITTPKGAPVPGVNLRFLPMPPPLETTLPARLGPRYGKEPATAAGGSTEPEILARTGLDGTFTVEIPASTFTIYAYPPSNAGVPSFMVDRFTVGRVNPRFDYRYEGIEVTGTVRGPTGDPVTLATVVFVGHNGYGFGRAQFDGTKYALYLPPGGYTVYVDPPSPVSGIPSVRIPDIAIAADTTVDFSLTGHLVSGTVTGPDGATLTGATVYFDGDGMQSGANSDAGGRYSLYAPTSTYRPYAYPPYTRQDIYSRVFTSVSVAGPTTVDLAFTGITWSGVVRESGSGAPIAGATVRVRGLNYLYSSYFGKAWSVTDGTGAFRLYLAGSEGYRLDAIAPGFAPLGEVDRWAENDSTFDLYLQPPAP